MNVGQDDLDVGIRDYGSFLEFAVEENGGTSVRSTLLVFDAVSATAIPSEVKLGEVVTIPRASGFGVVSVAYKYLGFTVGVRSLGRHIYQATNGMICVVNSIIRSPVLDAKNNSSKMSDDEMRDAVVLAFASTCTSFTAARSGKNLTSGHKDKELLVLC